MINALRMNSDSHQPDVCVNKPSGPAAPVAVINVATPTAEVCLNIIFHSSSTIPSFQTFVCVNGYLTTLTTLTILTTLTTPATLAILTTQPSRPPQP
jgi:hypothetical protein